MPSEFEQEWKSEYSSLLSTFGHTCCFVDEITGAKGQKIECRLHCQDETYFVRKNDAILELLNGKIWIEMHVSEITPEDEALKNNAIECEGNIYGIVSQHIIDYKKIFILDSSPVNYHREGGKPSREGY